MAREKLSDRRHGESIEIEHVWAAGTPQAYAELILLTFNSYADGRLGECFIDYPHCEGRRKMSERTLALGQDVAVLISIALQFGAPIEVLCDAMSRADVNVMGKMRPLPQTIIGTVLEVLAREVDENT